MRFFPLIAIWLGPLAVLQGCATQGDGARVAEQTTAESEDTATCRQKSGDDAKAFDACRKAMADKRAQEAAVQVQKRRDFDRVLGAGTDGDNNY